MALGLGLVIFVAVAMLPMAPQRERSGEAAFGRLAAGDVEGMLAGLDAVEAGLRAGPRPDLRIATAIQVIRDVARRHRHAFEGGWR